METFIGKNATDDIATTSEKSPSMAHQPLFVLNLG
jgi:hypothetical protein